MRTPAPSHSGARHTPPGSQFAGRGTGGWGERRAGERRPRRGWAAMTKAGGRAFHPSPGQRDRADALFRRALTVTERVQHPRYASMIEKIEEI